MRRTLLGLALTLTACDPAADAPAAAPVNRLWIELQNASNVSRECSLTWAWTADGETHTGAFPLAGQVVMPGTRRGAFVDVPSNAAVLITGGCWKAGEVDVDNGITSRFVGVYAHGCRAHVTYQRAAGEAWAETSVTDCGTRYWPTEGTVL